MCLSDPSFHEFVRRIWRSGQASPQFYFLLPDWMFLRRALLLRREKPSQTLADPCFLLDRGPLASVASLSNETQSRTLAKHARPLQQPILSRDTVDRLMKDSRK